MAKKIHKIYTTFPISDHGLGGITMCEVEDSNYNPLQNVLHIIFTDHTGTTRKLTIPWDKIIYTEEITIYE